MVVCPSMASRARVRVQSPAKAVLDIERRSLAQLRFQPRLEAQPRTGEGADPALDPVAEPSQQPTPGGGHGNPVPGHAFLQRVEPDGVGRRRCAASLSRFQALAHDLGIGEAVAGVTGLEGGDQLIEEAAVA